MVMICCSSTTTRCQPAPYLFPASIISYRGSRTNMEAVSIPSTIFTSTHCIPPACHQYRSRRHRARTSFAYSALTGRAAPSSSDRTCTHSRTVTKSIIQVLRYRFGSPDAQSSAESLQRGRYTSLHHITVAFAKFYSVNPNHLDIVECWKGLSYTQARELAVWYQFLDECLRNEVHEALRKDSVNDLLGSQGQFCTSLHESC